MRRILFFPATLFIASFSFAQDILPGFTVKNLGNNRDGNPSIVISWANNYDSLRQISIQTSHDSLRGYRTLISLTDPNAKLNGYADRRAPNDHMYYKLFIVKGNGQYLFTGAKRPSLDTTSGATSWEKAVGRMPDTRDGKRPDFVPSFYVYTNKDGYVLINLPDAEKQKYHVKFFEEDNTFLFEVKSVRQSGLVLDKTNFLHAGWFNFELYNDEKLVERHKIYLSKDF